MEGKLNKNIKKEGIRAWDEDKEDGKKQKEIQRILRSKRNSVAKNKTKHVKLKIRDDKMREGGEIRGR